MDPLRFALKCYDQSTIELIQNVNEYFGVSWGVKYTVRNSAYSGKKELQGGLYLYKVYIRRTNGEPIDDT